MDELDILGHLLRLVPDLEERLGERLTPEDAGNETATRRWLLFGHHTSWLRRRVIWAAARLAGIPWQSVLPRTPEGREELFLELSSTVEVYTQAYERVGDLIDRYTKHAQELISPPAQKKKEPVYWVSLRSLGLSAQQRETLSERVLFSWPFFDDVNTLHTDLQGILRAFRQHHKNLEAKIDRGGGTLQGLLETACENNQVEQLVAFGEFFFDSFGEFYGWDRQAPVRAYYYCYLGIARSLGQVGSDQKRYREDYVAPCLEELAVPANIARLIG